jgi:hypothetical protein
MNHGASAHGARLDSSEELTVSQTMVADCGTGLAQSDDLGVGGRVRIGKSPVPATRYDLAITDDDSADWHFARIQGTLGRTEGFFHPEFVGNSCQWSILDC